MTDSLSDTAADLTGATEPKAHPTHREDSPGVLRGRVTLTLQTRQAQRLVRGRSATADKPSIIGLIGFAHLLRAIWQGARMDDPYADWWLLKIHDALTLAQDELSAARQDMTARLDALDAIEVALPESVKPAKIALNFSNPCAFGGARLLSTYDGLVRAVLSARHIGLATPGEAESTLHQNGRQVRRALQSPLGYRLMGVTRLDVERGTARSQQATDVMGTLPDDVQTGDRRAPHAPTLPVPTDAAVAEHIPLRSLADLK